MPIHPFDLRDAVAAYIAAGWGDSPPAAVFATQRIDEPDVPTPGRLVYVQSLSYAGRGQAARAVGVTDHVILITITEAWLDPGDPPDSWVRGLVGWVLTEIVGRVGNPEYRPLAGVDLWPQADASVVVCDQESLMAQKLFWSDYQVTFRVVEDR